MLAALALLALPAAAHAHALAPRQASSASGGASSAASSAPPPTTAVTTAVPSPTLPLTATLPSQAALPPAQAWCPSQIFCAGELLQTLNIAQPYSDSKTIVDKPTVGTPNKTLADFAAIASPGLTSITEQQIVTFLDNDFQGEGLELAPVTLPQFTPNPPFLKNVSDPLINAFASTVHGFWTTLTRETNASTLCNGVKCASTLIPLNHTFVVPGGRFREQYYWDSFFILQGLLTSRLFEIANNTLQNFMDELDAFGFVPNGARIYYLNRSQPPFFVPMLASYVNATGDMSILKRGLPAAEKELAWWRDNRAVNVTAPSGQTHTLMHYSVTNTAPRPESYLADYLAANGPDLTTPLSDDAKAALYAELASGAETGWDYSSRWMRAPLLGNATNPDPALRTLNVRATIPVDLNSILFVAHSSLADLYTRAGNHSGASTHAGIASTLRAAILDTFWEPSTLAFYDFNSTAGARSGALTAAHWYPLWAGIHPPELLANASAAFGAFASVNFVMNRYNGTMPATFVVTGQQWDAPNAWPPHQWLAVQALRNLPANVTGSPLPTAQDSFTLIPSGQLGVDESALPPQNIAGGANVANGTDINAQNGTVLNGGAAVPGEGWADALARMLANRYVASVLCSWHATGGSLPAAGLQRLPDAQLNITAATALQGQMFEKFSIADIDSAGRGGEYTVQAGFGWTNGVLLAFAEAFGPQLAAPTCPILVAEPAGGAAAAAGTGAARRSAGAGGALVLGAAVALAAVLAA